MRWRNARFTEHGTIVCEVLSGEYWLTFHATPDDTDDHGRFLYFEVLPTLANLDGEITEE